MRYLFPYLTAAVLVLAAQGCKGGNAAPEKEVTTPKGSTVSVSVFPGRVLTTSRLQLSTTLTHKTFQYPKNTQAVSRAESMLREGVDCIGQFTMDWGAGNTNPSKDTYDFRRLDERVRLIRRLGKKVVLTLCRCPQWMRRDDPSKGVDAAPRADMYEEFAHMAADFLRHYRDLDLDIYAVNVWSETRGYWSKDLGRWLLDMTLSRKCSPRYWWADRSCTSSRLRKDATWPPATGVSARRTVRLWKHSWGKPAPWTSSASTGT